MFAYLSTHDGPVVEGLEQHEKVYAENQRQYLALRTLPGDNGKSAISRWTLSDAERIAIVKGADIMLELSHFGEKLQPVRMMITDQKGEAFPFWFQQQTLGPYNVDTVPEQTDVMRDGRMALAAFKNFHRSLCERFGYRHDEIDWDRDQVSLEEHISSVINTLRAQVASLLDFAIGVTGSDHCELNTDEAPDISGVEPVPQEPVFVPSVFRVSHACVGHYAGCDGGVGDNHSPHCPEFKGILHNAKIPDLGGRGEVSE